MTSTPQTAAHGDPLVGSVVPSGTFRADLAGNVWQWSDEVYALHGLEPGQIVPTTDAVLAHVHGDDRRGVEQALRAAGSHGVVSTLHRLVGADGRERVVCLVGQAFAVGPGAEPQLVGHLADLTRPVERRAAALADASIQASARHRADIEQAKAVVAVLLDLDDDLAFDVLRRRSNRTNVPLRLLARDLVHDARAAARHGELTAPWLTGWLSSDESA
jgi:hypothetical protein